LPRFGPAACTRLDRGAAGPAHVRRSRFVGLDDVVGDPGLVNERHGRTTEAAAEQVALAGVGLEPVLLVDAVGTLGSEVDVIGGVVVGADPVVG
jgi:hypothetical protein